MSSAPLLESRLEEPRDVAELRVHVQELEREVRKLRQDCVDASRKAVESLLRQMFSPLHRATSTLVGESSAAEVPSNDALSKWRNRFGPTGSRLIEILELGPSTRDKLRPALGCGWSTLDALLKKFKDVGLIEKDGGSYGLRV